ncbi:MAG: phosphogluconate dehydrogenase (NAD(+)-dependent, decarboxylating) [Acidimicrobiales bacterium]
MQLGMIGAGRMGANMARRLARDGHSVVMFDVVGEALQPLEAEGFETHHDLGDFVSALHAPRAIWMMIPAAHVGQTIDDLRPLVAPGDVLIDGGNSWYRDAIDRAGGLAADGVLYVDCGTSGGVLGLDRGYCLMIGGDFDPVERLEPIFRSLAPGVESQPRTPGRSGPVTAAEEGYLHCGPSGAGHFAKMVHNGIEYAVMAAYAEGLNVLRHAGVGDQARADDAETTPLRDPVAYQYDFAVDDVAEVWRRGSVIGSWLLDLTAAALRRDPALEAYSGSVSDSGEGRWTLQAAIDIGVPTPALSAALFSRFESRGQGRFAAKVLSAMREEFGGHVERPAEVDGE